MTSIPRLRAGLQSRQQAACAVQQQIGVEISLSFLRRRIGLFWKIGCVPLHRLNFDERLTLCQIQFARCFFHRNHRTAFFRRRFNASAKSRHFIQRISLIVSTLFNLSNIVSVTLKPVISLDNSFHSLVAIPCLQPAHRRHVAKKSKLHKPNKTDQSK